MWLLGTLFVLFVTISLYMAYLPPTWLLRGFASRYPDVLFDVRTDQPVIALTIDDAPHPDVTPELLKVLKKYGVAVTFFVLGEHAKAYPELLGAARDAGHELANHMYSDRKSAGLPSLRFLEELLETQDLLEPFGGSRWCRPGTGVINQRIIKLMVDHDFVPTLGSAYPLDLRVPEFLASQQFLLAARPGAILVLHDGAERTKTLRILDRVLPELLRRGYRFVTLTELVDTARN